MIRVGLDIDGSITEHPGFMASLSRTPGFEIHVLTGRDPADHEETVRELSGLGISHANVHYADAWCDKARLCRELGIAVFIEDQDEYIRYVPANVFVLKARNGGNYDFEARDRIG